MKILKQILAVILIASKFQLVAQSASVFDASYFDIGGTKPLIEVGKGINITDVFKPTKQCFMPVKLKATQNSQNTKIDYYYTKTEAQYNTLKSQGNSGQISYLNLFSIGGSSNSSYSTKSSAIVERIVIVAKVDFGLYSVSSDPILKPEAKTLLTKSKFNEFIEQYGTHYINGVRKESSIWITLTKKSNSNKDKSTYGTTFNEEFSPPTYPSFKIETIDNSEIEKALNSEEYTVNVEIKGPPIKGDQMQQDINGMLTSGTGEEKMQAIAKFIEGAFKNISDPKYGQITQYYYSPFSLYGLKGIQWDEKKLNQLININKNVITLNTSKSQLDKIAGPDGLNYVSVKFDKDVPSFGGHQTFKSNYIESYNNLLPTLTAYRNEVDTTIKYLEKVYKKCCNIYCSLDSTCAFTGPYEERVKELNTKIKAEVRKMSGIKNEAWNASRPPCAKEGFGFVVVKNISSNPYQFVDGDQFVENIPGKSTKTYQVKIGKHYMKATQISGYMMYPTVNNRDVEIKQTCEEKQIMVGFED